jgi:hypothetical protein
MKDTLFIRLLHHNDKGIVLSEQIAALREGRLGGELYAVVPDSFRQVPNTPFCYWVSERIRRLFAELPPFESEGRTVKQGLATADDFRFVRAWWEVPAGRILDGGRYVEKKRRKTQGCEKTEKWKEERIREFQAWCRRRTWEGKRWAPFAKGGEYSPYYADIHLVVNWENEGMEIRNFVDLKTGRLNSRPQNIGYYFRPGLTWTYRTNAGFSVRVKPSNTIHGHVGHSAFCKKNVLSFLSWFNSSVVAKLLLRMMTTYKWEVGYIQNLPVSPFSKSSIDNLQSSHNLWLFRRSLDFSNELSHAFELPEFLQISGDNLSIRTAAWVRWVVETEENIARIQAEIDEIVFKLYGITEEERKLVESEQRAVSSNNMSETEEEPLLETADKDRNNSPCASVAANRPPLTAHFLSWCIGVVLGRFDIRHALDSSLIPDAPDPFDPLPVCSPGMLMGPDGLPAKPGQIVSEEWLRARPDAGTLPPEGSVKNPTISDDEYPIRISWDGILVDDPGFNGGQPHRDDIVRRVREVLELLWGNRAQAIEEEACEILGVSELREYFRKPSGFFQDHLKRYSKSRRKAPIYWPLSTASGSYTVWLYYHRLNDQTLFAAVNKYIDPKIAEVQRATSRLESEIAEGAGRGAASLRDRLNEGRALLGELQELREELLRVADLPYKPNLNDGVIITAAPLHRLFRLRSWAKDTKSCWEKLERGDYDWAHLAYTLWPERVKEVCRRDRSIAIAHGLEDLCEIKPSVAKRKGGRRRTKEEGAR